MVLGAAGLLAVGLVLARGFHASESRHLDAKPLIIAGRCWLHGLSPYRLGDYDRCWVAELGERRPDVHVFAYPPTMGALVVPLGMLGMRGGELALDLINVAAFLLALGASALLVRSNVARPARRELGVPLSLFLGAILCGPASATLLLGQSGLIVLAALLVLWTLPTERRQVPLRVACIVVLSFKPTMTLPVLGYLLFADRRSVLWAALVSLLLTVGVAMLGRSGFGILGEWSQALHNYSGADVNQAQSLVGVNRLMSLAGHALPPLLLAAIGGVGGAVIGVRARVSEPDGWQFADLLLCLALTLVFAPVHAYDLVLVLPFAAALAALPAAHLVWFAPSVVLLARPNLLGPPLGRLFPAAHGDMGPVIASLATLLLLAGLLALRTRRSTDRQFNLAGG